MNSLYTPEIGQLSEYAERLRRYSDADLEDIYHNIHVLRYGPQYRMLLREMERRGLRPCREVHTAALDLGEVLSRLPALAHNPRLACTVIGIAGAAISALVGFSLLIPIWIFVVLWDFVGIQTWPVYITLALAGPLAARSLARDWMGPRCPTWSIWAGLAMGVLSFALTGMASNVLTALAEPRPTGGMPFAF